MTENSNKTKTGAGSMWMKNYMDMIDDDTKQKVEERKEKRNFRFGNNIKYPSQKEVTIPLKLGKLESRCKHPTSPCIKHFST